MSLADSSVRSKFYQGLCLGVSVHKAWPVFLTSSTVRKRSAQSLVLNGGIFLASIYLVETCLFPLFRNVVDSSPFWLAYFLNMVMGILYYGCWLLPLYVIQLVMNMNAVTEVAKDTLFTVLRVPSNTNANLSSVISDVLFETVFVTACMIFAGVIDIGITLAPYTSDIFWLCYPCSIIYWTWIYAFCAFNTKWKLQGVGVLRRINAIQSNAAFYCGFGTPLTLLTYFYPNFFVNAVIYALLYPWFVIIACASNNGDTDPSLNPMLAVEYDPTMQFPVFKIPYTIASRLLSCGPNKPKSSK